MNTSSQPDILRNQLGDSTTSLTSIGKYRIYLREIIGDDGHVYAVEPNPKNVDMFERSVSLNGYENISIIEAAVSDSTGTVELTVPNQSDRSTIIEQQFQSADSIQVSAISVDELISRHNIDTIDLIKMDIQGAEAMAIQGMIDSLPKINYMYIDYHTGLIDKESESLCSDILTEYGDLYQLDAESGELSFDRPLGSLSDLSEWTTLLWVNSTVDLQNSSNSQFGAK